MAESASEMTAPPLLENILGQPDSLRNVAAYHFGEGLAALERAAVTLRGASRIVLSGMGSSLFACFPLEVYLNTRGIVATAIDTSELLHYRSGICTTGTIVVLVSRSGETVEAVKLLPLVRRSGASVIGVTNEPGTSLHNETEQTLLVGSARDQLVAVQTYSGTIAALLLLGAAVSGELREWRAGLESTAQAMDAFLEDCVARSETWRPFFEPARAVYLVGRGASVASVFEGALLFHEASKTPAVGMTAAHFRHGPVEVVDGNFRSIVFASQRKTADLDAGLAGDLNGLGARVFPIGPYVSDGLKWHARSLPEELAPILEIAPVQIAALRLAQWKGLTPGEFRIAPMVTRTEVGFGP